MRQFDVNKVKDACVAWIQNFFEKNGPGCNAVLGISGGKDSMLLAKLMLSNAKSHTDEKQKAIK